MNKFTGSTRIVAFGILLGLTTAVLAKEKEEDADESSNEVTVEKLTLVRDAGDTFEPVKSFKPTDTLAVLVKLSEPKLDTKVKGIWTIANARGTEDKTIREKQVPLTADA